MGAARSLRRKLNAEKVFIAEQVAQKRTEIVKKFVEERVKTDVEFATDVLKAVGDALPEDIKKEAEATVKNGPRQVAETSPEPIVESQAKELLNDGTFAKLIDDAIKGKLQVNPNVKTSQGRIYPLKTP